MEKENIVKLIFVSGTIITITIVVIFSFITIYVILKASSNKGLELRNKIKNNSKIHTEEICNNE